MGPKHDERVGSTGARLLLIAALAFGSACSDDDNDAAVTPTPTEAPSPTVAPSPSAEPAPTPAFFFDSVLAAVDPLMGSGGGGFGQPNIFVGAGVPFGMVKVGPDTFGPLTGRAGFSHAGGYWYPDDHIDGFSQLHMSGTGVEDYGNFLVTAHLGMDAEKVSEPGYTQAFSHDEETAAAGYYRARLLDTGIEAEMTATAHAAVHRYTYPEGSADPVIIFDLSHGLGRTGALDGELTVDVETGEISGWMLSAGRFTGEGRAWRAYVSAVIEGDIQDAGVWQDDTLQEAGTLSAAGAEIGAWLQLPEGTTEALLRVGVSFIDVEAARANRATADGMTFEQVRSAAETAWDAHLNVIEVEGTSADDQAMLYSALFRSGYMPTLMSESDGRYVGLDREVHASEDFLYYSDLSLWDTYRTFHPLAAMVWPQEQRDFARTLVVMADHHGAMPRWPLAVNETGGMLGSPGAITVAETWLKGLFEGDDSGFDIDEAWDAMIADADVVAGRSIRGDFPHCIEVGWCPQDHVHGSVSKSIEYGWADFALHELAEARDNAAEATRLGTRSLQYRDHFENDSAFLRGRLSDGDFWRPENLDEGDPYDSQVWTDEFVEGNAWQYLFAAPYDLPGLADRFPTRDAFMEKLDELFELSEMTPNQYVVEPIRLPDLYYWHGNEPDIHVPYAYALMGEPNRGMKWIDWVRNEKYDTSPDGLDGNDDAGTLSAWYVFSALGFYPLAGSDLYMVGTPVFTRATVHLEGGDLVIEAPGAAEGHLYIASLTLNGEPLDVPWFRHGDIAAGGTLRFELSAEPTDWGRTEPLLLVE